MPQWLILRSRPQKKANFLTITPSIQPSGPCMSFRVRCSDYLGPGIRQVFFLDTIPFSQHIQWAHCEQMLQVVACLTCPPSNHQSSPLPAQPSPALLFFHYRQMQIKWWSWHRPVPWERSHWMNM